MKTNRQTGFSLVEIVIALAVVSLGLIAVIGLIPQGTQAGRDAADNTLAATIAHDTLNTMRLTALTTWPPTAPPISYYDAQGTNSVNNFTTDPQDAYFHIVVTPTLSATIPNLYVVTAMITWPDKPGITVAPPNTNIFVTTIADYEH
ncbi:MAG TPA: prepilin-type N-terminal cleavage/methylation domain-containing protein [Verrucomicrobiae bacterium]|nr:prepilin-type N-terminal cleavage/methylation domain-containing protein [Verrucomicrobiae bacterium]